MKLRFLIGLFLVILISGCSCVITTLKITDARMAKFVDERNQPVGFTTVFSPDAKQIYCWFSYKGGTPYSVLKGSWYYENALKIESVVELKESSGIGHFSLVRTIEKPLPVGNYRVDISTRSKVLKSILFSVLRSTPIFRGLNLNSRDDIIQIFDEMYDSEKPIIIVYGENAKEFDLTVAFQVETYLKNIRVDSSRILTKSDKEISENDYNNNIIISVGGPCINEESHNIVYEYKNLEMKESCGEFFSEGSFVFESFEKGNELHLMIVGGSLADTREAGIYISGFGF